MPRSIPSTCTLLSAGLALLVACECATAQSTARAVFVANNGNLQGSVSAFRVEESGALTFVDRVVTGSRTSLSQPCAGCNASAISLSPNGRWIATGHPAGSPPLPRGIAIVEVAEDASLSLALLLPLFNTGSPLGVQWIDDTYLAVTRADFSAGSSVAVYQFDPTVPSLSLVETRPSGAFNTALAVDPSGPFLFAQDSTGSTARSWRALANGSLSLVSIASSGGIYPLGIGLSPNGQWLYGGGGISGGGNRIVGFTVVDGVLQAMPQSPFTSPGQSPKQIVVSRDNAWAYAAHGTDGTIRAFAIDPRSGALAATGASFNMGGQGALGTIATSDGLLFASDRFNARLLAFSISTDGSLVQIGPPVGTQGTSPEGVATWDPRGALPCPADLDGDGAVTGADLATLLGSWGPCPDKGPCAGDLDGDGAVGGADLAALLAAWGEC